MKRCMIAGFLTAIFVLSIQFMGCGSDKKAVEPTPGPSMNDPSYIVASAISDEADAMVQLAYIWSLVNAYMVMTNDPEAPTYHAGSGFWYKEETQIQNINSPEDTNIIINTVPITIEDSLRFWQGGTAVQTPNPALLTRIEIGIHIWLAADSSMDSLEAMQTMNITADPGEFLNIDSGLVMIAGSGSVFGLVDQLQYADSTGPNLDSLGVCEVQATMALNYTGLALYIGDLFVGCPTAGAITGAGPIDVTYCQGVDGNLEFPATWTSTMTFNGDAITIVIKSPTRTWTKHTTCGDL